MRRRAASGNHVRAQGESAGIERSGVAWLGRQPARTDRSCSIDLSITHSERAIAARLPTISPWRQFPEAGGLFSYGANLPEMFRRVAEVVGRILKGAKPSDMSAMEKVDRQLRVELRRSLDRQGSAYSVEILRFELTVRPSDRTELVVMGGSSEADEVYSPPICP